MLVKQAALLSDVVAGGVKNTLHFDPPTFQRISVPYDNFYIVSSVVIVKRTRSSAVAERPRDASCH